MSPSTWNSSSLSSSALSCSGSASPGDEHRAVAVRSHLGLDPVEDLGEDGVVQVEHEDADGPAASVGQASGGGVGPVAEFGRRAQDGLTTGVADLRGAAHRQRHQGLRHPGAAGDVVDRRAGGAHAPASVARTSLTRTGAPVATERSQAMATRRLSSAASGPQGLCRPCDDVDEGSGLAPEGLAEAVDEAGVRIDVQGQRAVHADARACGRSGRPRASRRSHGPPLARRGRVRCAAHPARPPARRTQ